MKKASDGKKAIANLLTVVINLMSADTLVCAIFNNKNRQSRDRVKIYHKK